MSEFYSELPRGIQMSDRFVKVSRIEAFPEGKLKKVQLAGEGIVVAKISGKIYAITASCTHRGAPLDEGELEGTIIVCPWHGGQFDITTGKVVSPPPMKDEVPFDVQIQGSDVLLKKKKK
jgi:nitrite reductase/ring-hydroxylating ferredoxin subunit